MKKLLAVLVLSIACASTPTIQRTEFNTVSAAVAGVEAARSAYQDFYKSCTANPVYVSFCSGVISDHDSLMAEYGTYSLAVKALADANIAVINVNGDPTTDGKVAAATAGLLQVAGDFVTAEKKTTGGK